MSIRAGVAAIVAALAASGAQTVLAADLPYPNGRYGQAYEDPRYGDIYGIPPPRHAAPAYTPHNAVPPPVAAHGTYPPYPPFPPVPPFLDPRGYLREMPPPAAFDPRGAQRWNGNQHGSACLPRHVVRHELERQGWFELQEIERRNDVVLVRARQPNGRWFDLTVDRCDGSILEARVLDRRAAGYDDWRQRGDVPGY